MKHVSPSGQRLVLHSGFGNIEHWKQIMYQFTANLFSKLNKELQQQSKTPTCGASKLQVIMSTLYIYSFNLVRYHLIVFKHYQGSQLVRIHYSYRHSNIHSWSPSIQTDRHMNMKPRDRYTWRHSGKATRNTHQFLYGLEWICANCWNLIFKVRNSDNR